MLADTSCSRESVQDQPVYSWPRSLIRRKVECQVIDGTFDTVTLGSGTVVHPRSLELFDGLESPGPLLTAGVKQRVAHVYSQARAWQIDLSTCGSRYGFNHRYFRGVTESILTEYLHQQRGTVIRSSSLVRTGGPR